MAPPGVDDHVSAPIDELAAQLPDGTVVTDPATSDSYRHDSASFCAAGAPLAVVRPTTTEQVRTVLRWASAHRVPVVPQGARTGLSGGANAVDGAAVLATSAGCLVRSDGPVVVLSGVEDLAVVVENGVVLVAPRKDAGAVRAAVEAVKRAGRADLL